MKVALVHDWLNGMRGGEKVLEVLCALYPHAEIFTLLYEPEKLSETIRARRVHTSFIQRLPLAKKYYRHYLPLFPAAIEQFDLRGYDLVISTSHCVAKGALTQPGTPHICFCHTPMRYAWEQYHEYFPQEKLGLLGRCCIPLAMSKLRVWDVASSQRVDFFIANSQHVAKRIHKYYGRDAMVVHPPVDGGKFHPQNDLGDYYFILSALVPYKRIDRAIAAFNMAREKLMIVGDGPEYRHLRKMAGPNIAFLRRCAPEALPDLYARCRAFIFPGEEDFGITPLEAMAAGRPVIALGKGGALETVQEGKTGLFFQEPTASSLLAAVKRSQDIRWDGPSIRARALEFDRPVFARKLGHAIGECLRRFKERT
ncbi:glycosyltransferase [candidate division FCPU426 bacterium]|nr:glycosyltransferase [candidate division FCPU426 bacterium]